MAALAAPVVDEALGALGEILVWISVDPHKQGDGDEPLPNCPTFVLVVLLINPPPVVFVAVSYHCNFGCFIASRTIYCHFTSASIAMNDAER